MINSITLQSNEILQANPYFEDSINNTTLNVKASIRANILADYRNGVRTGKIDIIPNDYDDINEDTVYTWANGEIIRINDLIKVFDSEGNSYVDDNGYDIIWRVTGKTLKYDGQVIMTLELRETKDVE